MYKVRKTSTGAYELRDENGSYGGLYANKRVAEFFAGLKPIESQPRQDRRSHFRGGRRSTDC